jgi:hypothetical protein
MKTSRAVRAAVFAAVMATVGCQDTRSVSPTASSLFIPSADGVWSGPMTLLGTSGGECVGAVVPTFLPANDLGTVTLAQSGADLKATMTMESTGLACKYSGSATVSSLALNATECDRHGLIVACVGGQARELRLVGSSVNATWNGDEITGRTTTTYNVFTPPEGQQVGVGSLIATHNFTAKRR